MFSKLVWNGTRDTALIIKLFPFLAQFRFDILTSSVVNDYTVNLIEFVPSKHVPKVGRRRMTNPTQGMNYIHVLSHIYNWCSQSQVNVLTTTTTPVQDVNLFNLSDSPSHWVCSSDTNFVVQSVPEVLQPIMCLKQTNTAHITSGLT